MIEGTSEIAKSMYNLFTRETDRECSGYAIRLVNQEFWGLVVQDHVPIFNEVYKILQEKGNIGRSNKYVYGDIDVGVWVEPVKDKNRKVIASTRYCSMADDNTHIYITEHQDIPVLFKFICKTAWPRQKKRKTSWGVFGDHRDIDIPSIATYRKYDFKFGYNDCRDKGYVFKYTTILGPDVEYPENYEIGIALRALKEHLEVLKDYDKNKCY